MTRRSWLSAGLLAVALGSIGQAAQGPTLSNVLARAGSYALQYQRDLPAVIAVEEYAASGGSPLVFGAGQPPVAGSSTPPLVTFRLRSARSHAFRSDYVLLSDDSDGWLVFRDVFEIDRQVVRTREDRLTGAFQQSRDAGIARATAIARASEPFKLGAPGMLDVPMLPLLFVRPENVSHVDFSLGAMKLIDGIRAVELRFRELGRPTIVEAEEGYLSCSGALWVDPETGRVLRTLLHAKGMLTSADVDVTYDADRSLGVRVPSEMKAHYEKAGAATTTRARYSAFRRFRVGPN